MATLAGPYRFVQYARAGFKFGEPNHRAEGRSARLPIRVVAADQIVVRLPRAVTEGMAIEPGDLLHVADSRWWLGGFRSLTAPAGVPLDAEDAAVLSGAAVEQGHLIATRPVRVEKLL